MVQNTHAGRPARPLGLAGLQMMDALVHSSLLGPMRALGRVGSYQCQQPAGTKMLQVRSLLNCSIVTRRATNSPGS